MKTPKNETHAGAISTMNNPAEHSSMTSMNQTSELPTTEDSQGRDYDSRKEYFERTGQDPRNFDWERYAELHGSPPKRRKRRGRPAPEQPPPVSQDYEPDQAEPRRESGQNVAVAQSGNCSADEVGENSGTEAEAAGAFLDRLQQSIVIAWLRSEKGYEWHQANFNRCSNVLLSVKEDIFDYFEETPVDNTIALWCQW